MKEDKMKNIFDKIMIGIFTILCFGAFFMVVTDLPYSISAIIGYDEYDGGYELISFFACAALLGYVMDYYKNKRDEEKLKTISEHSKEMTGLNNFWKLNDYETTIITNMEITELFKVNILIKNKYLIQVPIDLFSNICTPKDLTKLDNYINTQLNKNIENQKEKLIFEMHLNNDITDYLKKYKSEVDI